MRLTSRAGAAPEPVPVPGDDLDSGVTGLLRYRRLVIRVLLIIFLVLPAAALLTSHPLGGRQVFLILATLVFVVLVDRTVLMHMPEPGRYAGWQWALLPMVVALGAVLFAVGHTGWLTALAVASAAVGRVTPDGRTTVLGLVCCTGITVAISAATGLGYVNTIVAGAVVALGNLLAHSAERRNVLMYRLKETRAELARAAVAEERLRISRDLHDLLGHSLSLITLKAELAGRLMQTDPERARHEVADVEAAARKSLADVRAAVSSYRQPVLAAELAAARRMLAVAGISCRVEAPASYGLPARAEAALAWAVREGVTNVVRHSGARSATITVASTGDRASVEILDDGVGPRAEDSAAGAAGSGSGLAGITERATQAGGQMNVGSGRGGKGFRLQVLVPVTAGTTA